MALSKTAAIKQARTFVSLPHRRSSTDYVVHAPWDSSKPHGASTELQASTYPAALAMRTRSVARVAVALMGVPYTGAMEYALAYDGGTVEHLVGMLLRA